MTWVQRSHVGGCRRRRITAPSAGTTVSGAAVSITADASDNVGIAGVQVKVDGVNVGPEDTTAPYGVTWDTRAGANGSDTLTAVARDAAGNTATSAGITVTVANTAAGPVAAYGFNESTGALAGDSSGSGNNGTLVNGPTHSSTSKYGLALQFDGVNDMVTVPDANSLDLTTAMSIEAWVRPTALGSWRTVVLSNPATWSTRSTPARGSRTPTRGGHLPGSALIPSERPRR